MWNEGWVLDSESASRLGDAYGQLGLGLGLGLGLPLYWEMPMSTFLLCPQ